MSAIPEALVKLRHATHEIHSSLELLTDSDRLLGDAPSRSHYRQLLAAQILLHREVAHHTEPFCRNAESALLDWPDCQRLVLLETDLTALEGPVAETSAPRLPLDSYGFTLGLVYVCEGSCLGNQRLLRSMGQHDCFDHWNARRFLESCSQGFAPRWREVITAIDSFSSTDGNLDLAAYRDIERGALAGFAAFREFWADQQPRVDRTSRTKVANTSLV